MAEGGRRGRIAFIAVWLAVWSAGILIVLWMLGAASLRGDFGAAPFLVIWLGFAGLGLYAGLRRLQALVGLVPPAVAPTRPPRPQDWKDGMPERRDDQSGSRTDGTAASALRARAQRTK